MGEYIEPQDVREAAYGLTIPDDAATTASLNRLIDKAEARLLVRVPTIPGRVADGALDVELVRGALEDIVLRVVRNPDGYTSETAEGFSYRIDRAVASGRVQVTDDDVRDLLPRSKRRAVGSIRVHVPSWRAP